MRHILCCAVVPLLIGMALTAITRAQNWVSLNGPQIASNVRDISVTGNGVTLYCADNSYVLKSTNSGTGWAVTPQPYSNPLLVLVKPDDGNIVLAAKNGLLSHTTNGGGLWSEKINDANLVPLRLVAAVNDANMMLLGRTKVYQDFAIYRSPNGGATWFAVTQFAAETNIHDFAPYPNNTDGWAAGTVWAGGAAPSGTPGGSSNSSVATTNGLWVSTDYGLTWTADRLGNRNVRSVALVPRVYPTDYIRLVVDNVQSGNDILLRNISLSDPGLWTEITLDPAPADIYLIRRKNSNGYLFLATSNGVWRSTDDGVSFHRVGLNNTDVLTIAASSTGNTVFAGTATTLHMSTDNGSTWTNVGDMDASSVEIAQISGNQTVWAVTRDNAFAPKHSGTSWITQYIGSPGNAFSSEQVYRNPHNNRLFAVGAKASVASVYYSTDDGVSYTEATYNNYTLESNSRYYGCVAHPTETTTMYLFGGGTLRSGGTGWRNFFKSSDGGLSWSAVTVIGSGTDYVHDMAVISGPSTVLYAALSNGDVYKSTDGGLLWTLTVDVGSVARTIAINLNNTAVVYAGGDAGLWKTTNAGSTWSQVRTDNVIKAIMHPSYQNSTNYVWIVGTSRGTNTVLKTTDGGSSWTDVTGIIAGKTIRNLGRDLVTRAYIYAATSDGVFRMDDAPGVPAGFSGTIVNDRPYLTWNQNPEPDVSSYEVWRYTLTCQHYCPDKICGSPQNEQMIATTSSTNYTDQTTPVVDCPGGLEGISAVVRYYIKAVDNGGNRSAPTGTVAFHTPGPLQGDPGKPGNQVEEELPHTFSLEANYPNPFNPITSIKYALPEDVHVVLRVYDVLGRVVATLVDQYVKAGWHEVIFDASVLSSGVYFYRMTAGDFMHVRKLLLMR